MVARWERYPARLRLRTLATALCLPVLLFVGLTPCKATDVHNWNEEEKAVLRTLVIDSLPPLPVDPSNGYASDPAAAALGKKFFFDSRFSGNRKVSCATCHRPDYDFTDNLPLSHGMDTTPRRSMPLIGVAYNAWYFWDGRKDSLWSQALGPIESPLEHGISRTMSALLIVREYRDQYTSVFGPLPDLGGQGWPENARPAADDPEALKAWVLMPPDKRRAVNRIYVNMGKAIGAYVRLIMPEPAPFDRYARAVLAGRGREVLRREFSDTQAEGLRLFIGKARCVNCHNGPLFTNGDFHNLGLPPGEGDRDDPGRAAGIIQVLSDEFNCLGEYSDAQPRQCLELRFLDPSSRKYAGAFKTPTLRSVAEHPPYMHAGQFDTLREVLEFYRRSEHPELEHGELTDRELLQVEAFLKTLSSPLTGF